MMLKLTQISKSFVQRGVVLDSLDLELEAGSSLAITGPSGSGKTTLMNIIGLLDRPDSGTIHFNGRAILGFTAQEAAHYRNRDIGFVFQNHLLLPYLTVMENILLPVYAFKTTSAELAGKKKLASELMEKAGILSIAEKYPFNISGGEAQRVAVIRALVNKPSLLLADEPTGSLDLRNAELLADLLVMMNTDLGISLIVTTHSPDLAARMGRRLRLDNGKLSA
jgi:lipoprotein-releasing system ATP-binding protein